MNRSKRTILTIGLIGVLGMGAAIVSLRAAEQKAAPTAAQTAATAPAARPPAADAPAAPSTAKPAPQAKPPASAPEESATIKDDPTVAPDPQESADNSVTFPADI